MTVYLSISEKISDIHQIPFGFLVNPVTQLVHVEILFLTASFHCPVPVALHGAVVTEVQDMEPLSC